jgi:hypothetical protein
LDGAPSGPFGIEAKMNAFVGLEADMHGIPAQEIAKFRTKESRRGAAEDNDDFRGAGGEGFPGAKIKGNS